MASRIRTVEGMLLMGLLCGVGASSVSPSEATVAVETPAFVREPADRPVIDSGTAGWPSIAADPSLLVDAEGYHLFYTALFCARPDGSFYFSWDPEQPAACDLSRAFGGTAYAFSADQGQTWEKRSTPVLSPGPEAWNDGDVETPFAVRVDDRLLLFYSSFGTQGGGLLQHRFQIGAAWLDLGGRSIRQALLDGGAVFTHRPGAVVAADLVQPHGVNNAQEPSVVVRDGRLELFFVTVGLSLPDQDFTAPGQEVSLALRVAGLGPDLSVVEPPSDPLLTGPAANIAEVRFVNGRYHLFATTTALDDHEGDQITYAVSETGRDFGQPVPILSRRAGAAFDNWGVMAPTVAVLPEATVLLFTGWEVQEHVCNVSGAGGRMGMPVESQPAAARCLYATLGRAVAPPLQ